MTLTLFITTFEPDPVLVSVETLRGFHFTGYTTNNSALMVELPHTFQLLSDTERDKGIRVRAENQSNISVYGLNYEQYTSDGFLALPCHNLQVEQYEYYGIAYYYQSHLVIVGCEDNTIVNIGFESIELNRMETYYWESSGDVTGTRVLSNRPIAVIVGHTCTNVPYTIGACDHLTEQVPPTALWGTTFLSASLASRDSGDLYRILASHNSTSVAVNCNTETLNYTLSPAGSWVEFSTPSMSFCSITSDKPLLVMQFALGHATDGVGDPFMMMIIPVEQYSKSYAFEVLPEFLTNFVTVYTSPEDYQPHNIYLSNSNLVSAQWNEVYCSDTEICGYIAYLELSPGEHQLFHANGSASVGLSVYGFNFFNSYGYPGGILYQPLGKPA